MYCEGNTTLRGKLHSQILNADTCFTSLSDNEGTNYLLQADKVTFILYKCNKRYGFSN